MPGSDEIDVIVPTLKRRLSGVTATVLRLLPIQAKMIGIAATGWLRPEGVAFVPLARVAVLPRDRVRIWHARRNNEMLAGIVLRGVLRRRLKLLFTSAGQRRHTGYTRWLIRRMDGLIATSPQSASYLERPARVILHGIDCDTFHPETDRPGLRRALGLPEDGVLIGCFGRPRAQKGTDVLVEAALSVLPRHPEAVVLITGRVTGQHQGFIEGLKRRIEAAGLGERVRFLGEVDWGEVVRLYRALDLFVAPARWEGFGLTPLEAMASGVPAIASRGVGTFDAQVVEGHTGLLVPPGDAAALAEAMEALLADPEKRRQMAAEASAHVRRNFRIEDEAARIVAVYRELLQ